MAMSVHDFIFEEIEELEAKLKECQKKHFDDILSIQAQSNEHVILMLIFAIHELNKVFDWEEDK